MSSKQWIFVCAATAAVVALGMGSSPGEPGLKSIGALEIGPDGVVFVADSEGAAIYAYELEHPAAAGELETIDDLDLKIAALLGSDARDVAIQDLAVHEPSRTAYVSVMAGRGGTARPALVSIAADGSLAEVKLDAAKHTRLALDDAPAADAELYHWKSRSFTVTDMELIDGELYIAGLSNEEFASTLRRAPYPFRDTTATTGLEIYHGGHGAWETFAPIFSFVPYELSGKRYLLAGYLCTPLVTFPLEDVKKATTALRGKTIAELGWGNIPTDIVPFELGGEAYVLIVNNRRGNMVVRGADIEAAQGREGITHEVEPRTGVVDHTVSLGHVVQAATYDRERILVLTREMENGALELSTRPTNRLWS